MNEHRYDNSPLGGLAIILGALIVIAMFASLLGSADFDLAVLDENGPVHQTLQLN
jgi:hypothetical protein